MKNFLNIENQMDLMLKAINVQIFVEQKIKDMFHLITMKKIKIMSVLINKIVYLTIMVHIIEIKIMNVFNLASKTLYVIKIIVIIKYVLHKIIVMEDKFLQDIIKLLVIINVYKIVKMQKMDI